MTSIYQEDNFVIYTLMCGLPRWPSGKESACQCRRFRRCGFSPWVWKIPWRRKWQPTPIFLPGKFHEQRSLTGSSLWCYRVGHDWVVKQQKTKENSKLFLSVTSQFRESLPWFTTAQEGESIAHPVSCPICQPASLCISDTLLCLVISGISLWEFPPGL